MLCASLWLPACLGPSTPSDSGGEDDTTGGEYVPLSPECDPLVQDCGPGEACYNVGGDQGFACEMTGESAGGFGDPCDFPVNCSQGFTCSPGEIVPGCSNGFGCCTAFCDVGDGGCPGGTECRKLYESGAPPGFEGIGLCVPGD